MSLKGFQHLQDVQNWYNHGIETKYILDNLCENRFLFNSRLSSFENVLKKNTSEQCLYLTLASIGGSGLVEPSAVTVVNTDNKVVVKISRIENALASRVIIQKSENFAHEVLLKTIDASEFKNVILKSGNAVQNSSDGAMELSFDRSECRVSDSNSQLIQCNKKDFSGTSFQTKLVTKESVKSDEKSVSFTKLEIILSSGIYTRSSLQTPFSYYSQYCK